MDAYSQLRKNPFVRLLIIFISAILLSYKYQDILFYQENKMLFFSIVSFVLLVILVVLKQELKIVNILLLITLFNFSLAICLLSLPGKTAYDAYKTYSGAILDYPTEKQNSILLHVKLDADPGKIRRFKAMLYTNKDDSVKQSELVPGTKIYFHAKLNPIKNYGNPFEFDYRRYLSVQGTYFQGWLNTDQYRLIKSDNFYSRYRITLEHIRGYVQLKTSEYIKGKDERAIIQALTVGVKEELSEELKQNYINAGVVHVLAISGLHVGIIYMVLSHLLFFFDRNVYLRILRLFLIICAIWFYAVISGMSPSIVRACTMFTLLGIAKSTNRNISIFNVVAASALFMLIANPLLIFDLGFQLSYLAVTGIIYFQPLFYNWIHFNNRVLDYFYKLFTVSLAAQVSTSPLSVFYFHQFPVYFWLSNIFIIILIIIILSGSFLFILASAWGAVADIIGKVLELITHLANRFIDLINSLPYSVIAGISLTKLQVILFFCIIVAITIWLKMKISRFFVYTATLLLFFIITSFYNYYKHTANLLVIYNLPKQSVIGLYGSNYNYLLHNNSVDKRNKTTLRPFETHLIQRKAEENLKIYSIDSLQFLTNKKADKLVCSLNTKVQLYKGTSIVLLKKQAESELAKTEINNSDFIFVLGGVFPKEIQNFRGKIILSSELSAYEHNAWIKKLTAGKIPFHDIRNEGAFMLNY